MKLYLKIFLVIYFNFPYVVGMTTNETTAEIVARVLAFDPEAIGKARKSCVTPVEIQKPNTELFDDPQHNGQYWGE